MPDNIPDEVKTKRLNEIIALQNEISRKNYAEDEGKIFDVMIDGSAKKNAGEWRGRTSQNKTVVFPATNVDLGQIVRVKIESSSSATLKGVLVTC